MEAKDGSFGFDFGGVYDEVSINESISYTISDGRKMKIAFIRQDNDTQIIESFEAEQTNAIEMQQVGWQAILDKSDIGIRFAMYAQHGRHLYGESWETRVPRHGSAALLRYT